MSIVNLNKGSLIINDFKYSYNSRHTIQERYQFISRILRKSNKVSLLDFLFEKVHAKFDPMALALTEEEQDMINDSIPIQVKQMNYTLDRLTKRNHNTQLVCNGDSYDITLSSDKYETKVFGKIVERPKYFLGIGPKGSVNYSVASGLKNEFVLKKNYRYNFSNKKLIEDLNYSCSLNGKNYNLKCSNEEEINKIVAKKMSPLALKCSQEKNNLCRKLDINEGVKECEQSKTLCETRVKATAECSEYDKINKKVSTQGVYFTSDDIKHLHSCKVKIRSCNFSYDRCVGGKQDMAKRQCNTRLRLMDEICNCVELGDWNRSLCAPNKEYCKNLKREGLNACAIKKVKYTATKNLYINLLGISTKELKKKTLNETEIFKHLNILAYSCCSSNNSAECSAEINKQVSVGSQKNSRNSGSF